jgi:myo-inositol-1(or 4)-monophosphatase
MQRTSSDDVRLEFMIDLAKRAGELGMRYFRDLDSLTVESKGHQDMVSQADREVELFVRAEIARQYPQDGIVGEEHAPARGTSGYDWVIDPIDGTANFVLGIPAWTVVIACTMHGRTVAGVIHEPSAGETFSCRRGGGAFLNGKPIRTSTATSVTQGSVGVGFSNRVEGGKVVPLIRDLIADGGVFFRNASGALMLAYVACGRLLGYVEEHMNAWDCLAGLLLIEEGGGRIFQPDPATVLEKGTLIIASAPGVYDKLADYCARSFGT